MEQLQITQDGYIEIKAKIKSKLNETVNNFIEIGYHLKVVRDNMLYKYDGYKNMEEFAAGEYRISGSTASRFIDINSAFSVNGNSLVIRNEYVNYGYSKLQEMLTVAAEDWQLISEDTTVKQIREIKAADREEKAAEQVHKENSLPVVQMVAGGQQKVFAASQEEITQKLLAAFWATKPNLLQKVKAELIAGRILAEEICPSGNAAFRHGTGMIFMYEYSKGIKIRYYMDGHSHIDDYTYSQFMDLSKTVSIEKPEINGKETAAPGEEHIPAKNETAAPEKEPEETEEPEQYTNIPGQMTIEDLPELEADTKTEQNPDANVIDAEYRDIDVNNDADSFANENKNMLPCPFCGGKAIIHTVKPHDHVIAKFMPDYDGGTFIECTGCTCAISGETEEKAIAAWNRRIC